MSKLEGKVAVITGGNSGIGLESARNFINEGAKVVIFGRNKETLDKAAEELGSNAFPIQGDVSNLDELESLFKTTSETFGKVDVLFVNAGIAPVAPLEYATTDHFDQVFNINVKGAYFTVQKAVPYLNEGASVILNTSVVNVKGMQNMSVYSASKAAVRSLARTLSSELIEKGIRVNAVSPGPIETPIFNKMGLTQEQQDEFGTAVSSMVPMKRFGKPNEVANTVTFLASADSSYIVGSEIAVDGGLSQI
jgi:NAD(P)-dependent dehydrogenase (short-subunit alcohol dehydrogenase family)